MPPVYTLLVISLILALILWFTNDDRGTHP